MNILDIINKKVIKGVISYDELKYVIDGYLNGSINDSEMSSLLMAIRLNNMTEQEIFDLVDVMINSVDNVKIIICFIVLLIITKIK